MAGLFPIGSIIYFNAYASKKTKEITYHCKGIVARHPTQDSKVYKVYVVSVASIQGQSLDKEALSLLGKKIPKYPPTCTDRPADWWLRQCKEWISISERELFSIKRKVNL